MMIGTRVASPQRKKPVLSFNAHFIGRMDNLPPGQPVFVVAQESFARAIKQGEGVLEVEDKKFPFLYRDSHMPLQIATRKGVRATVAIEGLLRDMPQDHPDPAGPTAVNFSVTGTSNTRPLPKDRRRIIYAKLAVNGI